jgi:Polyketide cyclase / dehydrase and lipid transport
MPHYQATVRSARSAPETFDYLATFSNAAHWDPGVTAGEQLDPGPVRAGTRFHPLVRLVGRSIPLTYAVTSYDLWVPRISSMALARRVAVLAGQP